MPGNLQPLVNNQKISNPDGTPTEYFIKWAQQRQIDITAGITSAQATDLINAWAAARDVFAGAGLDGGGSLAGDVTLTANVQEILDLLTTTQGSVIYRGASAWAALAPGTSGHFLKTNGAGANPAWAAGGGGGGSQPFAPWTVPLVADFTQVNVSTTTFTDNLDGIACIIPAGLAFNARGLMKTAPGGNWNIYCHIDASSTGHGNNNRIGISVRNTTSGAISQFGWLISADGTRKASIIHWNSTTSYSGDSTSNTYGGVAVWMRLENDGTNFNLYFGDGYNWVLVRTETIASWVGTINEIGVMWQIDQISIFKINSYSLTAPAAGGGGPAA